MRPIKNILRKSANLASTTFLAAKSSLLKTDKRRWKKVSQRVPHWDERNIVIANLIPDGVSVLDLGSGAQTLRRHLKPGCQYQPCDVIQSSPDVIHCDFNSGIYPVLKTRYDYVICSGVFEYMRDPARFVSEVPKYGKKTIFTFNPSNPKQSVVARLAGGWVNHMEQDQVEQLFRSKGLSFRILHRKNHTPIVEEIVYELVPE
jgi:hypothetical protein